MISFFITTEKFNFEKCQFCHFIHVMICLSLLQYSTPSHEDLFSASTTVSHVTPSHDDCFLSFSTMFCYPAYDDCFCLLNFMLLWEWMLCHNVFYIRQNALFVRSLECMRTILKRCGLNTCTHVEMCYGIKSILKVEPVGAWEGICPPPSKALLPLAPSPPPLVQRIKWQKSSIFDKFLDFCPLRNAIFPLNAPTLKKSGAATKWNKV